jgi:FixJ family two-component response regulator
MPGMNGIELYQSLKRRNISLPFIFMSGGDEETAINEVKMVFEFFFRKPFDGQRLQDALECLGRS